ncbi:MAG: BtpA/SgcQ family protein [Planctomycetota bacterium]
MTESAASGCQLFGVVHLPPLPGSPRYSGSGVDAIVDHAKRDADAILGAGFDGYVIENFGDAPFSRGAVPPHVLTIMTRVALELPRGDALVVINVLRNDARGGLSVAAAANCHAIRVNVHCGAFVADQGLIQGEAFDTTRLRTQLAPGVKIFADVDVKHANPLGSEYSIEDHAEETAYRGLADALIVTGRATGATAALDDLRSVRSAVPDRPVFVGSGIQIDNAGFWSEEASGIIVGTALNPNGDIASPIDSDLAKLFVAECGQG